MPTIVQDKPQIPQEPVDLEAFTVAISKTVPFKLSARYGVGLDFAVDVVRISEEKRREGDYVKDCRPWLYKEFARRADVTRSRLIQTNKMEARCLELQSYKTHCTPLPSFFKMDVDDETQDVQGTCSEQTDRRRQFHPCNHNDIERRNGRTDQQQDDIRVSPDPRAMKQTGVQRGLCEELNTRLAAATVAEPSSGEVSNLGCCPKHKETICTLSFYKENEDGYTEHWSEFMSLESSISLPYLGHRDRRCHVTTTSHDDYCTEGFECAPGYDEHWSNTAVNSADVNGAAVHGATECETLADQQQRGTKRSASDGVIGSKSHCGSRFGLDAASAVDPVQETAHENIAGNDEHTLQVHMCNEVGCDGGHGEAKRLKLDCVMPSHSFCTPLRRFREEMFGGEEVDSTETTCDRQLDGSWMTGIEGGLGGEIEGGMREIESGMREIEGGMTENESGMREIEGGMGEIVGGMGEIEGGIRKNESGMRENESGVREIEGGGREIEGDMRENEGGMITNESGMTQNEGGSTENEGGMAEMEGGLGKIEGGMTENEGGMTE